MESLQFPPSFNFLDPMTSVKSSLPVPGHRNFHSPNSHSRNSSVCVQLCFVVFYPLVLLLVPESQQETKHNHQDNCRRGFFLIKGQFTKVGAG